MAWSLAKRKKNKTKQSGNGQTVCFVGAVERGKPMKENMTQDQRLDYLVEASAAFYSTHFAADGKGSFRAE